MAKYLKPRRGTSGTAMGQNMILKNGELFLEIPSGALMGKSAGRLVVGDGTTPYPSINYSSTAATFKPFITDPSLYTPVFDNSTYATSGWTYSASTASIDKIGNGTGQVNLPTIVGAVKETLCTHEDSLRSLNNDMSAVRNLPTSVSNLATSVSTLNTNVTNLNTTASRLTTSVSNLNTTASNLISTISTINTNVTNLTTTVSNLNTTVSNLATSVAAMDTNPYKYQYKAFRVKDLGCISTFNNGTTYTASTWLNNHKVAEGKFEDIEVGDILHISSNRDNYVFNFIVVDFDFYYGAADIWDLEHTTNFKHHVVIMPKDFFDMNTSLSYLETTGYNGSWAKSMAESISSTVSQYYAFSNAIGNNIVPIATQLTSSMNADMDSNAGLGLKGASTSNVATTVSAILPSEVEILGHPIYSSSPYEESFPYKQLAFFKYVNFGSLSYPYNFAQGHPIWTRTIGSKDNYVALSSGDSTYGSGGNTYRRPYIPTSSERCYMMPLICLGFPNG